MPITVLGHLIIPAEIDGRPARLVFDPIQGVILDRDWARSNGLAVVGGVEAGFGGRVMVGGAGAERREAGFVRDLAVAVGGLRTVATRTVLPLDSLLRESIGHRVDGLIGLAAFPDAVVHVSATGGMLETIPRTRFVPPPGARAVPVRYDRGIRPIITLELGFLGGPPVSATAYFDFGMAGNLRLTTAFADRIRIVDRYCRGRHPTAIDTTETGLGGALASVRVRLRDVSLAGAPPLADGVLATVAREREGADAAPEWDVLAGWGLMRAADWWFDGSGGQLWYRLRADAVPPRGSADGGLEFRPVSESAADPLVIAAAPGAAAAAAGLRPGDTVVVVGGERRVAADAERVQTLLSRAADRAVPFVIRRGGRQDTVLVVPLETLRVGEGCS
ncbi:MAG: hypothetical protein JNJ80_14195 [Gemmatimonadetes bacterium]|nr:hypothetical protein [Gemmatimonadota bacterium]